MFAKSDFSDLPSWNARILYAGSAEMTCDDYWSIEMLNCSNGSKYGSHKPVIGTFSWHFHEVEDMK
jgi:hypothetical protein